MPRQLQPDPWLPQSLHELAEGLQATATYLAAAHRLNHLTPPERFSTADMVEKATRELTRACRAFHQLQDRMSECGFQNDGSSPGGGTSITPTKMVTVHHFKVWDPFLGKTLIQPRKSSADRIAKAGGIIVPDSAEEVEPGALDGQGMYNPNEFPLA